MLTALGTALIYLVGVMPTLQLALAAIAGFLPAFIVIAGGMRWGIITYAATGLLSLMIVPDKGAALAYILVFGHWPMVKSIIERKVRNRTVEWITKIAAANIVFAVLLAAMKIFVIDISGFGLPVWGLILAGNICFILYDRCFTGLIAMFGGRFMKILFKS